MKIIYLGFIFALVLSVFLCTKLVNADSSGPAVILEAHVQPNTIKVNDTFSIYMTILNNSTRPIYLTSGSCTSAFSVAFDTHAKQVYPKIICTAMAILQEVDPHTQVTVSSANKPGITYQAVQPGTTTANVTLSYFTKNHTAADYSNIDYAATKSFQFFIRGNNDTSQKQPANFSPPLQQIRAGTLVQNVKCSANLNLVLKSEDGSPACVSTNTTLDLLLRGWITQNHQENQSNVIGTDQTISYHAKTTKILGVVKSPHEQRLVIALNSTNNGILSVIIPKTLLDLNSSVSDDSFYILTNSGSINPNETDTATDRTLVIPVNKGDNQVTISVRSWISEMIRLGSDLRYPIASTSLCDTPFVPKKFDSSPLYPNDTKIITSYTPVFFMPTNSTGKLCVKYVNWNSPSQGYITIFDAHNTSKNILDITTSPNHVGIPTGSTDVVYTIKSGNAGFYGIRFLCGAYPLAVGYDNKSNIVKQDFPWLGNVIHGCPAITYSLDITGTSGIGVYYIPEIIRGKVDYNITSTLVSSVHLSPIIQNITFAVNVQTFNDSSKFWFDIKDSQYVKFNGDPKLVQEDSNPCTWTFTNNNSVTDEKQWYKMVGKVTVKDRPVTIPPHTNATYTFSILAKNLDTGYYGFNPAYYGVPVDSNIPTENLGGGSIANYYPVTIGLDKYLDPSGICNR